MTGLVLASPFAVAGAGTTTAASDGELPKIIFWDPHQTLMLRQRVLQHDPTLNTSLNSLLKLADSALKAGPFSVTDKTLVPPSGDKHDFSTLGRYYWPNPKTPDGMPWIRLDGKTNPDYFSGSIGDSERFVHLVSSVKVLSRAAFLAGNSAYAEHAASLLRTWFINADTKMNPNARYGGRFPGNWEGVCYGIHGTRELMDIADSIGLLQYSDAWTPADQAAMKGWFEQYITWLTDSDLGRQERAQKNNHSIAFDCLLSRLAIFAGQRDLAVDVLKKSFADRITLQIEPDGKMPLELARATPWEYTRYALEFFFKLAVLGDREGIDLWHYSSADGRSIRGALDYLIGNICKPDGSIDADILGKAGAERVGALLQIAADVYHQPAYLDVMRRIGFKGELTLLEPGVNGILSMESASTGN